MHGYWSRLCVLVVSELMQTWPFDRTQPEEDMSSDFNPFIFEMSRHNHSVLHLRDYYRPIGKFILSYPIQIPVQTRQ